MSKEKWGVVVFFIIILLCGSIPVTSRVQDVSAKELEYTQSDTIIQELEENQSFTWLGADNTYLYYAITEIEKQEAAETKMAPAEQTEDNTPQLYAVQPDKITATYYMQNYETGDAPQRLPIPDSIIISDIYDIEIFVDEEETTKINIFCVENSGTDKKYVLNSYSNEGELLHTLPISGIPNRVREMPQGNYALLYREKLEIVDNEGNVLSSTKCPGRSFEQAHVADNGKIIVSYLDEDDCIWLAVKSDEEEEFKMMRKVGGYGTNITSDEDWIYIILGVQVHRYSYELIEDYRGKVVNLGAVKRSELYNSILWEKEDNIYLMCKDSETNIVQLVTFCPQ